MKYFNVIFFSVFLFACSQAQENLKPPYKIAVIALNAPTNPSLEPVFSFEAKNFLTLTNLNRMEGKFARLFTGGELFFSDDESLNSTSSKFEKGKIPDLRYTMHNGAVYPDDYNTLVMLSAYYQFEEIFIKLPVLLGITPNKITNIQPKKYFEIIFDPHIVVSSAGTSGDISLRRNAAFVLGQGQFLLFERSATERIPLASNLQVLAHEFGHAIFDYAFSSGISNAPLLKTKSMLSFNEGFADYFSYLITGSTNVLSASLGNTDVGIERNFSQTTWTISSSDRYCQGDYYCNGTLFANALFATTSISAELKTAVEQKLLAALSAAKLVLDSDILVQQELNTSDNINSDRINSLFLQTLAKNIAGTNTDLLTRLCSAFQINFALQFSGVEGCPL